MGSRAEAVKQYKKSENHWEKELKDLNNQNRILYSIAKKSSSRRELKISRISRLRLLIIATTLASTLPETNPIPTPPYPVIMTRTKIDSLLDVGR